MILDILFLILGFIILIKGADFFVDGASSTANNYGISKIFIGLTIVAFGTSAPELAVSIKSIISNNHDIVLGNVIGSNILNILLIIGISAIFKPLRVKNNTVKKELPITFLFSLLFLVLLSDSLFDKNVVNSFTRSDGVILLLFFSIYIYYLVSLVKNKKSNDDVEIKEISTKKGLILIVLGIVMIIVGSNLVVNKATSIATALNISEKLISLTIIALGTSLPELVTSVTATRKGECDIAIGNVVGSNIFNLGLVVGLPVALFGGISEISFNYIDLIVMLVAAVMLFFFSFKDHKISKIEGLLFLLVFALYYTFVIISG